MPKINIVTKNRIHANNKAFTLIEVMVMLAVLATLLAITYLGFGAWRTKIAETEVKNDINGVISGMENIRNFNDGYPDVDDNTEFDGTGFTKNIFSPSKNVKITYVSGDKKGYCVDVQSKEVPSVSYFYDSTAGTGTGATAKKGTCEGGEGATPQPPATVVASVATGNLHSCALVGGEVYCWGGGGTGRLGNGSNSQSNVPVAVSTSGVLNGKTVTALSPVSFGHTCVIANSQAYCWGLGTNGQLGRNSTSESNVPVAVSTSGVLGGKNVTDVSAGGSHTCAVADSRAYCWGSNGPLGAPVGQSLVPVAVDTSGVLNGKNVTAVSAGDVEGGGAYSCAIADGKAYCWGGNSYGQLGNNSNTNSNVPVAVSTSGVLAGKTITAISAGSGRAFACAIADSQAYCWGRGDAGQLGNNSNTNSNVPVAVSTSGVLAGKTITAISAGKDYACAIASGQAYCWGSGSSGKLGNNSNTNSNVPVAVSTSGVLAGKTITAISAGQDHTCAVASKKAYCWGENANGRLGNNSTTQSLVPVAVSTSAWD